MHEGPKTRIPYLLCLKQLVTLNVQQKGQKMPYKNVYCSTENFMSQMTSRRIEDLNPDKLRITSKPKDYT